MNYDQPSNNFIGPSENSILKSAYLLIQKVQGLIRQQKSDQNTHELKIEQLSAKFEGELATHKELLRQAEAKFDKLKSTEKSE